MRRAAVVAALSSGLLGLLGCSSAPPASVQTIAPGGAHDERAWPKDDRSLCGAKGHSDLESSETATLGAIRPNVRRVFKMIGEGDSRHKVLVCREMDTNLDGIKDVARFFNAKGEPIREVADSTFDGKLDIWITFTNGRISEEDIDTKHSGRPDVWKYYVDGKLSRVKRSVRCANGMPDTWEIYSQGRLDRVGTDDSCDGHVDRWDRDTERAAEEARKSLAQQDNPDGGADGGPAADGGGDAALPVDGGGDAPAPADASSHSRPLNKK